MCFFYQAISGNTFASGRSRLNIPTKEIIIPKAITSFGKIVLR